MHEPLPENSCLRQWIQSQQSSAFQDDACDPDRWRQEGNANFDPNEWPRHFLEIDYAWPVNTYPRDWEGVKARFGNFAEKNGQVPWHVETMYGQLVDAFRSKNATSIRNTLAHLSHYVTDAFSVLHNTKNFDPNGLHQRWESDMLDASSRLDAVSARAELYFGTLGRVDARNHIFDIVEVGNGLLPELVNADLANADMTAFFNAVLDLTARRWGDALTLQASLIASAWVDAGSPKLTGMSNTCSMEVPQGTLVLKGYALPPPRVEEDGGVVDDGGGPQNPPPTEETPTVGCTCQSQPGPLLLVTALALALRRRPRRLPSE